ncbi:polyprenyl synthetase family protein [Streptomyces harbinensis]|uniref:polyprenyl synthetase family protein n=1 Tax=Streptomyces harbinensis TaxID=1176198 RepID=UPI00339973D1
MTTGTNTTTTQVRAALERRFGHRAGGGRSDELDRMNRHAVLGGGKLLRPLVLLEFGAACGTPAAPLLGAAEAVEVLHSASLVHDDIIDGDDLRRGRPALHRAYGTERALVTGDALFFMAFSALTGCVRAGVPAEAVVRACAMVADTGEEISRGVLRELALSGDWELPPGEGLRMAGQKTGALLALAAGIGVVLGGGDAPRLTAATAYGHALGIAFQLRDDLLPWTTSEAVAGKPAASDLRNRRAAMPLLLAWQYATPAERARLTALTADAPLLTDDELLAGAAPVLHRTDALARTRELARAHATAAKYALTGGFPPCPHRDRLLALTDWALSRES